MRCLFTILLVAATTGLIPALAMAGNQEAAEQIAANLRNSGKLGTSKVTVKYMDGTAWLDGAVRDQAQMNAIVRVVNQTTGVRQVVNEMTIAGQGASQESGAMGKLGNSLSALNPLRRSEEPKQAQSVPTSFASGPLAIPTSAMQPIPTPAPPAPGAKPIPPAPLPPAAGGAPVANGVPGGPLPMHAAAPPVGMAPMRTDNPALPGYAWPSYAAYPNYAAVTYPKQYSPTAWPYIGPFYPYPQVPLGWRKVTMEWDDGWWFLDFKDEPRSCWWR